MARRGGVAVFDQLAEEVFWRNQERPVIRREGSPPSGTRPGWCQVGFTRVVDRSRQTDQCIQDRVPFLCLRHPQNDARRGRNKRIAARLDGWLGHSFPEHEELIDVLDLCGLHGFERLLDLVNENAKFTALQQSLGPDGEHHFGISGQEGQIERFAT